MFDPQQIDRQFQNQLQAANSRLLQTQQGVSQQFRQINKQERPPAILAGFNVLAHRPCFLTLKRLRRHFHILASTGAGKSYYLRHLSRSIINHGRGLVQIDPIGDLHRDTLAYCVRWNLMDRVIIIDPGDDAHAAGLNPFDYDPSYTSSSTVASLVMRAWAKIFGENIDEKVQAARWERNTFQALIEAGFTPVHIPLFLSENPEFRQYVLGKINNPFLLNEWAEYTAAPTSERLFWKTPVLNRANKFVLNDNIRRIVGQPSTINFRASMDAGEIILVNLSSDKLSQEEKRILGAMIIDKLYLAALGRLNVPKEERMAKQCFLMMDEFDMFANDDLALFLQKLRNAAVSVILAHQELAQLRYLSPAVYAAVQNEAQIKLVMKLTDREQAEHMAKQLFTGRFRDDLIQHTLWQTKFRPVETTRTVQAQGGSEGESTSEAYTQGRSHTSGESWNNQSGYSYGENSNWQEQTSHGSSLSQTFQPDGGGAFGLSSQMTSFTESTSEGYTSGTGGGSSESWSSGSSEGGFTSDTGSESQTTTQGRNRSRNWSESVVPWYEQIPFKEISSIAYKSIQGLLEKFTNWIQNQTDRHGQLKVEHFPTVPIVTLNVEEVVVREKDVAAAKERVYDRYCSLAADVDKWLLADYRQYGVDLTSLEIISTKPKKRTKW